ncbi:MAG TPA: protein kinase, partial [Vicinamibacterales bacterium]|nr:protein kinase [Vicinamibacterales bacterium]
MPGMLVGTAAYMSPEQAKGRAVDKRTDIFAFGCVVYEMLTGKRAFDGEDVADILSAVLRSEPDWTRLPANVPASVRNLLRLCLEKNAKNRRSDATDVRLDIEQALNAPTAAHASPAPSPSPRARESIAWIAAATALTAAAVLAVIHFRPTAAIAGDVTRLSVDAPLDTTLEATVAPTFNARPAISPDGRKVAFIADAADGSRVLSLRDLSAVDAQVIPNTKGADRPFWSPDGRYLGFVANGQLQKIAVSAAGAPETICPVSGRFFGATWNAAGVIVFASLPSLYRVDAQGGRPAVFKEPANQARLMYPQFLPDGRNVLYTAIASSAPERGAFVASLDTGVTTRLSDAEYKVVYSRGYLLSAQNGALFAQAFDTNRLQLVGDVRRLPDRIGYSYNATREAAIAASESGHLVYVSPLPGNEQLTWFDRSGKVAQKVGGVGEYRVPALSPDGRKLAFDRIPPANDGRKVWVLDLETETLTRITASRSNDWAPLWSPDGRTLVFSSDRDGPYASLYVHSADGQGADRLLLKDFDPRAQSWGTAGIVISGQGMQLLNPEDQSVSRLDDLGPFHAQFSPDGKFIAYDGPESGTNEVYVRRYPPSSERWRVSLKGGIEPHWKADGRELFYLSLDGRLIAAKIQLEPQVNIGREETLFQTSYRSVAEFAGFRSSFVVAPD